MNRRSLRFRLTVWYCAALLTGLSTFAVFLWIALRQILLTDTEVALRNHLQGLEDYIRVEEAEHQATLAQEIAEIAGSFPTGILFEVLDPSGTAVFKREANVRLPAAQANMEWQGRHYLLMERHPTLHGEVFTLRMAASIEPARRTLIQFGWLLVFTIPGFGLAATAGGYWLSRRALAPVDEITQKARSISIQNLSERLPRTGPGDEIGRLAEAWNDLLARLETSVNRISEFTSDASHELRTPIAFIRSTAEIALRRSRSERLYRESLENIQTESERMTSLVDNLLFLARADARIALEMNPVDLLVPLRAACGEIAPVAFAKQIELETPDLDESYPVLGVESALRRLLLVLLENAVKYTPAGGVVSIALAQQDGSIRLTVADTGEGIESHALPHVFERFYRADSSRSRISGGYGLGLSIAQTIARQHGAWIEAESIPGQGAKFHLTIPLVINRTVKRVY